MSEDVIPINKTTTNKKRVKRKSISVQSSELIKTEKHTQYNWFQRLICKWIKVTPADTYTYYYRIKYTSNQGIISKTKNNILINKDARLFAVLDDANRFAVIVTMQKSVDKPFVHGTIYIHESSK